MAKSGLMMASLLLGWSLVRGEPERAPVSRDDEPASHVSKVWMEHQPAVERPVTAATRAAAARAFLDGLTPEQHSKALQPLDSPERSRWTNLPAPRDSGGVRLGTLDEAGVRRALDLLACVLSEAGYERVRDIALGDDQLLTSGRPRRGFGTAEFWLILFGTPDATQRWALQLDGHHLAVNLTMEGDALSASPRFLGAQPALFTLGDRRVQPLSELRTAAESVIQVLSPEQRMRAVQGPARHDLVAGAGRDGVVPEAVGLDCAALDAGQRKTLSRLLLAATVDLPAPHATTRQRALVGEIDQMHFAWWGPVVAGADASFRLQGPTLLLEFAGQDLGGDPAQHLHAVVRDPTNEYGAALGRKGGD